MTNIYAPPTSDLSEVNDDKSRKPKSAWVVEVLAALMIVGLVLLIGTICLGALRDASMPNIRWLVTTCILVAIVILFLAAIICLHQRHRLARPLGLCVIAIISSPFALSVMLQPAGSDSSDIAGKFLAVFLVMSPSIYWAYAFGFSRRARHNFESFRQ